MPVILSEIESYGYAMFDIQGKKYDAYLTQVEWDLFAPLNRDATTFLITIDDMSSLTPQQIKCVSKKILTGKLNDYR